MSRLRSQTIKAEAFLALLLLTGEFYFIDFSIEFKEKRVNSFKV
jgi:hypothetical protein